MVLQKERNEGFSGRRIILELLLVEPEERAETQHAFTSNPFIRVVYVYV